MQGNPFIDFLEALETSFHAPENRPWAYAIPVAMAVVILFFVLRRIFRKRRKREIPLPPELRIELAALGEVGPPPGPPLLEFYNLPMRLAGVVLAPVGRLHELPPPEELPAVLESVLPGLDRAAERQRPLVRRWPNQVSTRGFASAFFSNLRLPDGGKGTPWSAAAGIFKHRGAPIMLGLVLRAAAPNSLGQVVINAEYEWLGCLRVKQHD